MAGAELLWVVGAHLVLTGLPGVAAALLAARLGVRSVPVLLVTALAMSGSLALLAFWLYFAEPLLGKSFSFLVLFGSILVSGWVLSERRIDRELLRALAVPLGLWVLGTYFLVFFGFVHGGTEQPLLTGATRFSGQLPSDSGIPFFFGEWFYLHGHSETIPVFPGEWLSSDRPPLQIGYLLLQRPLEWDSAELHYMALGIVLQQLWIVGLWALLLAGRVGRVTKGLAMITVLLSDVALINGFYVWPKMLPTAMLLAAAALVLTPLWDEVRGKLWGAALLAALLGLAMMGHGASVFAAIPLAAVAAWRGMPSWRWIGVALAVGIVFMAPWSAYQKWVDPPGNRVTKWMLAGSVELDDRGLRETIFDAYGEDGLGAVLHNKGQNFVTMAGGGPMVEALDRAATDVGDGDPGQALEEVRLVLFFNLLPSLGLLLIVPIVMALRRAHGRRRPEEWRLSLTLWAAFAIGAVAWGLLIYGNLESRTVLHAGSFAIPVFGFVAAVVGLRAVAPRFAIYYAALATAVMLAIFAPSLSPPEGSQYSALAILISTLALAAFCLLSLRRTRESSPSADASPLAGDDLKVPALRGAVGRDLDFDQ